MQNKFDTVVIGAGAAGLMCAYQLAAKGKRVLLLDHSIKLAEKIRISGGGRCNFTNLNISPESYISQNPYFCISALSRYTQFDFMALLDKYGITYHEKTLGQLFCDKNSGDIINLLDMLCNEYKVVRKMGISIVQVEKSGNGYIIHSTDALYQGETLVVATGGLSIPQIGATGFGYNIARQFGLNIIKTLPALVPLSLEPRDLNNFAHLSGVSFKSLVYNDANSQLPISFIENVLLTHRGLSGPAILQISSYWNPGEFISINLLPDTNIVDYIEDNRKSNKLLSNLLTKFFTQSLSNALCVKLGFDLAISQLSNQQISLIASLLHKLELRPSGTLGYKKAEVTKGGIDTDELSSKTMMAKKIEGLFFIGEVVDVTGWLGGYNFQWAWSSAVACASSF
jgi:predicted Rossmann fold flavoprotein